MAQVTATLAARLQAGNLTPPEINALLFYRLGQLVVWGREHGDLVAAHTDLSMLLDTATQALSHGGVLEPESANGGC